MIIIMNVFVGERNLLYAELLSTTKISRCVGNEFVYDSIVVCAYICIGIYVYRRLYYVYATRALHSIHSNK